MTGATRERLRSEVEEVGEAREERQDTRRKNRERARGTVNARDCQCFAFVYFCEVVRATEGDARIEMSAVQAFLVQGPYLHSSHALAASWCHRAPAASVGCQRNTAKRRPRWLPLMEVTQDEMGDVIEPTLEQSLDAIDDVYMDRLPGEGES